MTFDPHRTERDCGELKDDLRELVDEWRESSESDAEKGYDNAAGTWAVAAKELEAVLEDE